MRVLRSLTDTVPAAVRRPVTLIATVLVALLAGTGIWLAGPPSAGAADGDVTFNGRGFGHGRGMSQWGAYGYAVDLGADYRSILDHYYGGTTLAGDAGNPAVKVELTRMINKETVISGPGLNINGYDIGHNAIRIRGIASNTFEVLVGDGCAGPWTLWQGPNGAQVVGRANIVGEMRMCETNQVHAYRGNMIVLDGGGYQTTVNELGIDDYLRGVLPREVPASWGSAGGGRGMEALKVQAVAARSYALSSTYAENYADTCDTTACQVYGGAYTQAFTAGAAPVWLEDSRTSTAVDQTSGQVRRTSRGAIARAEFSASTGGWTAGGEFPAVEDLGDNTAANPNRAWSVTFARSVVASKLGIPAITSMRVSQRNGLGADGGRVLQVTFETTGGTRTFTGDQVRSKLGMKSDWFTISTMSITEARSFVRALYIDVLGREGDPDGVQYWSSTVAATGDVRGVAAALAGSGERFGGWVNVAYANALHRAPDQAGGAYWWNQLNRGWTLNQLNAGVYGSGEAVQVLGGGDGRMWVEGLYQNLLGRGSSPEERLYWATRAGQEGFVAVAGAISQSAEACDRRLSQYYDVLLGRAMDPGGRSTFSPTLAGSGDVTAVTAIASSAEYWQRALIRFP